MREGAQDVYVVLIHCKHFKIIMRTILEVLTHFWLYKLTTHILYENEPIQVQVTRILNHEKYVTRYS